MKQFKTLFEYIDHTWIASCTELRLTLNEQSFDRLVSRMKEAVQDIATEELSHTGDIQLLICVKDRIEAIKAVG